MTAFTALIELREDFIAEIGEAAALRLAHRQADRAASAALPIPVLQDASDQRQNFPRSNPDTGEELPATRCYRFDYRTEALP